MESVTLILIGSLAYHAFLFSYFDNLRIYESRALTIFRLSMYFLVGYVFNLGLSVFAWILAEAENLSAKIVTLCGFYFSINLLVTLIVGWYVLKKTFYKNKKGALFEQGRDSWS